MKRTLLAGSRCAYLFMTGCGDGSDKNDRAVKEKAAEEVEQVEEAEEKKEDHVGTRSNPLPVGQTIEDELAEEMQYALSKCLSMHRFTSRSKGRKDHRFSLKRHRNTKKTNDRVVRLFSCVRFASVRRKE
ncbi:hypothetical protein GOP80_07380 [Planococcaceae bacterium Storch 2/2-2]|nr:hypothetical protein [Planococcaceae bacterium Storch 2/2-2]